MPRASRVVLAGHTGLEKGIVAARLRQWLETNEPALANRVGVHDLEDAIRRTRGGHPRLFAGVTSGAAQRDRWRQGWELVQEEMAERRDECSILHMHLVFALPQRGHRVCPASLSLLADWKPDVVVMLIDDVYAIKRRIQLKNFEFSLGQLYDWRTTELMFADQLALISSLFQQQQGPEPSALCESMVVAVKHPVAMLGRMIADLARPRVYASFPISSTRNSEERRNEIDRFRQRLHELFITLDPLTIEEFPLLYEGDQRATGNSFHPLLDTHGNPKSLADQRWDCRVARDGDYAPLVFEPETQEDHLGAPRPFYPVALADRELNELWREVGGQAITTVDEQITVRDLRLVDQADCLVCYRPYWDGRLTGGVGREIEYANDRGKDVYAFVGSDTADPQPLEGQITHAFVNESEFWSFLGQKAMERVELPRPPYY